MSYVQFEKKRNEVNENNKKKAYEELSVSDIKRQHNLHGIHIRNKNVQLFQF